MEGSSLKDRAYLFEFCSFVAVQNKYPIVLKISTKSSGDDKVILREKCRFFNLFSRFESVLCKIGFQDVLGLKTAG
jgi:hypothetical protein